MERRGGIYKIVQKSTGKIYLGSTVDFIKREHTHWRTLRSGKHHSIHLQRAWEKYGCDDFEFTIVETIDFKLMTPKERTKILQDREQEFLDTMVLNFNMSKRADRRSGCSPSAETRQKMSDSGKGRRHTEESRRKISESKTGKPGTIPGEEVRQKLSAAQTGRKHSQETKDKMSKSATGRTHTEETKQKLSKIHSGRPGRIPTEETRQKLREARQKRPGSGYIQTEETRQKRRDSMNKFLANKRALESNLDNMSNEHVKEVSSF